VTRSTAISRIFAGSSLPTRIDRASCMNGPRLLGARAIIRNTLSGGAPRSSFSASADSSSSAGSEIDIAAP
jgi:hypothetical protein